MTEDRFKGLNFSNMMFAQPLGFLDDRSLTPPLTPPTYTHELFHLLQLVKMYFMTVSYKAVRLLFNYFLAYLLKENVNLMFKNMKNKLQRHSVF